MSNPFFQERLSRKLHALKSCHWPNPFLSDALGPIRPTELSIIGARTGAGKTEFATNVAMTNARNGKRVFFFALEAEKYEIERRIKYSMLSEEFFKNRSRYQSTARISFTTWLNDEHPELEELENQIDELAVKATDNLEIYSPGTAYFSKKDFAAVYSEIANEANLVVLDHIHYISPDNRENEYDHLKQAMWSLRDLINKHEVPVVAVSHLRKESRQNFSLVPSLDEIHGSSEVVKQANHVIGIAPCYKIPKKNNPTEFYRAEHGATFFRVLKTRTGHSSGRYIAMSKFDITKKQYEDRYIPFGTDQFATEIKSMEYSDFEPWMSLAREQTV